jgi:tetratricopeptide (TPR) repeat protein
LLGEELQPDMVLTYFGNNDPSMNGFLSDRELYELSSSYGGLKRLLSKSYIYRVLKLLILRWRSGGSGGGELKERVSAEEFADNLNAIRSWCREHACDLVICTIPTPDLWPPGIQFKVFAQGRDEQGRLVMSQQMRREIGGNWALCLDTLLLPGKQDYWTSRVYAAAFADTGDLVITERFYMNELGADPDNAKYLNNLAVVHWRQGRSAEDLLLAALEQDSLNPVILYNLGIVNYRDDSLAAETFLDRAKSLDNYSLRIKPPYNEALRSMGTQEGVWLADLLPTFEPLPENSFFVDHCHPTFAGHKLIADKLFSIVGPLIPIDDNGI